MFHVPNDSNDLPYFLAFVVCRKTWRDSFADDVLTGEIFVRETFVDDYHRRRIEPFVFVEDSALPQRNPHCFEIVGRDHADWSRRSLTRWEGTLFRIKRGYHVTSAQGQRHNHTG